jgi:hypothetical protein
LMLVSPSAPIPRKLTPSPTSIVFEVSPEKVFWLDEVRLSGPSWCKCR